jgi:pimeloyl-ACP methyl ester carboxylesterase
MDRTSPIRPAREPWFLALLARSGSAHVLAAVRLGCDARVDLAAPAVSMRRLALRCGACVVQPKNIAVQDAGLQVFDWGSGEPVVFIQTALTAEELRPLATDPTLDGYRKILYYRRGYAGSSPIDGPGSIQRDAADCAELLTELGVDRAHVVGLSFSGAIALQFASDVPGRTHSLTLIEPPPLHVPSADEFRAANDRLITSRQEQGLEGALDEFLTTVIGPEWHQVAEEALPGSVAQMRRDVATFFDTDLPALLSWRFGPDDAARIGCPVLYIGGSESGPWFAEVHELISGWIPHAEDVIVDGADHSLALTHAPDIAEALSAFLGRNPL